MQRIKDVASRWYSCAKKVPSFWEVVPACLRVNDLPYREEAKVEQHLLPKLGANPAGKRQDDMFLV